MQPHLTTCPVQALQSETDENAIDAEDPSSERLPGSGCHDRGGESPMAPVVHHAARALEIEKRGVEMKTLTKAVIGLSAAGAAGDALYSATPIAE